MGKGNFFSKQEREKHKARREEETHRLSEANLSVAHIWTFKNKEEINWAEQASAYTLTTLHQGNLLVLGDSFKMQTRHLKLFCIILF